MSAKAQKILKPSFNPRTQPGYSSRFANSPFEKFFGDWRFPLITGESHQVPTQVRDQNPEQKYKSFQSPNVSPGKRK